MLPAVVAPLVIAGLTLVGVYYMQGVSGLPFTNVFATSLRNGASAAWPPTMNGSFGSRLCENGTRLTS
jgi:hypothetical protein